MRRILLLLAVGSFALCLAGAAFALDTPVEVIEDPLPFYDPFTFRYPTPGDDLPPMRVTLSRRRYWQQDGHMDVVVRLAPPEGVGLDETRLRVRLATADGDEMSRFVLDPVPSRQFIFYPKLPPAFLGEAVIEVAWLQGEQAVAEAEEGFRVERFAEPVERQGRVRLDVPNTEGVRADAMPMTVGVPFPRGVLRDTANLRLVDEDGDEMPVQVKETAGWSKYGTVKWALCDFTVDLDGAPRALYLEYGPEVARTEREPMRIEDRDGFPTIEAGRLRFDDGVWFRAEDGEPHVQALGPRTLAGAVVEHEDGRVYRMPLEAPYEIEERGPEKVVVRRRGWYQNEDANGRFCKYDTRYVIHRDSPVARVFHTWIFTGDGNRDRIASMGWEFGLADGMRPGGFLASPDEGAPWEPGDYLVQHDYDSFKIVGQERRDYPGGRALGGAMAAGDGVRISFGAKDFWQNYPSELEFADGSLWFHNWPRHNETAGYTLEGELITERGEPALPTAERHQHYQEGRLTRSEWKLNVLQARYAHEGESLDFRLPEAFGENPIWVRTSGGEQRYGDWDKHNPESVNAQGVSRTEEMWLYLDGGDAEEGMARRVLRGLNEETLRAVVDPRWIALSGAFHEIHHQDKERFPEEERVYELVAHSQARVAEHLGSYGMWIHGDVPAWVPALPSRESALYRAYRKSHHGFPYPWTPFARTGDPAFLKMAEAAARQNIDVYWCHYVSDDLRERHEDTAFKRREGQWNVGPVPWAGGAHPITRTQHNRAEFLLHAWYMTGYRQAHDHLLRWGELTKIEEDLGSRGVFGYQGPGGNRTPIQLLKAYLETYEATFDPWFLVAAREIGEMHLRAYGEGRYLGRPYRTADRDYLRFTGCKAFEEAYLTHYARPVADERTFTHYERRTPQFEPVAYAWHLTRDEFYLRRVAYLTEWATFLPRTGTAIPDYDQGYIHRHYGTEWTLHTPWYLKRLPYGLRALAEADERPVPIYNPFMFSPPLEWLPDRSARRRLDVVFQKAAGEPVPLQFVSTRGHLWGRGPADPDREATYRVLDADGREALTGTWRIGDIITTEVPAEAPEGPYRLEVVNAADSMGIPVTPADTPEVIVLEEGQAMRHCSEGTFWFLVPEGVDSFAVEEATQLISVWNPEGARVWNAGDYPDAESRQGSEIAVPQEHAGKLWRVTVPAGNFRLDAQIPPIYSASPTRWFEPPETGVGR